MGPLYRSFSLALALVALGSAHGLAQDDALAPLEMTASTASDQSIEDLLGQAARAEGKGQWAEAVKLYLQAREALVERRRRNPERQIVAKAGPRLDWRLDDIIAARIAALPEEGQKAWLLTVEPRARAAMGGAAPWDADALQRVIERYPLTEVTREALAQLADVALEAGELSRAAGAWLELAVLDKDPARRRDGILRAARCAAMAQDFSLGRRVRAAASELGLEVPELEGLLPKSQSLDAPPTPMPGFGKVHKSGLLDKPEISEALATALDKPLASLDAVLSEDGREVYIADSKTLRCYKIVSDLELRWQYTVRSADSSPERLEAMLIRPVLTERMAIVTLNRNRPGRRIAKPAPEKGAEDPKAPPAPPQGNKKREDRDPDRDLVVENATNWRVVSLDRKNGYEFWDLAEDRAFEPFARNSEWISSPTIEGDFLYLSATLADKALRACLIKVQLSDGKIQWICDLASRSPVNHRGLSGPLPPPLVHEGSVYVATGIGLAGAVDAASGQLRWAWHYPTFSDRAQSRVIDSERRFAPQSPLVLRSANATLWSPVDSPFVFALNNRDGSLTWQQPSAEARYVALAGSDEVVLIGARATKIEGATGRLLAQSEKLSSEPIAPPLTAPGLSDLILPTRKANLRIRLSDLAVMESFQLLNASEAGALTLLPQDRWLSLTALGYTIFYSDKRLAENFDGLGGYTEHMVWAEYYERRGELMQALDRYSRALKTGQGLRDAPARLAATRALIRCLGGALGAELAKGESEQTEALGPKLLDFIAACEPLAAREFVESDYQLEAAKARLDFAQSLCKAGEKNKSLRPLAIRALQSLLSARANVATEDELGITADSRLRALILMRQSLAAWGAALYAPIEAEARPRLDEAIKTRSAERLRELVRQYPLSEAALGAHLYLADMAFERMLYEDGAKDLEAFLAAAPAADARVPSVLYRLAETLARRRHYLEAAEVLETLVATAPEAVLRVGERTGVARELAAALKETLLLPQQASSRLAREASVGLELECQESFRLCTDLDGAAAQLLDPGPYGPGRNFYVWRKGLTEAWNANGGLLSWSLSETASPTPGRHLVLAGGVALVPIKDGLAACDDATGRLLWSFIPEAPEDQKSIASLGLEAVAALGCDSERAYVLSRWGQLTALDAQSGKTLWFQRFDASLLPRIDLAGPELLLSADAPARLFMLNRDGRLLVDTSLDELLVSRQLLPIQSSQNLSFACVAPNRIVAFDRARKAVAWSLRIEELGAVTSLELSPDEKSLALLGTQQLQDPMALVVLETSTGRRLWSDDGRGPTGGFGRTTSRARIERLLFSDKEIFTVRQQSLQVREIWCQDSSNGQRRWAWTSPLGQGPQAIIETPDLLFVPHGGRLTSCTLTALARGNGVGKLSLKLPGRQILSARAVAGQLIVLSDRGITAFDSARPEDLARELAEMASEYRAREGRDAVLAALIADRMHRLGRSDEAISLLEKRLRAEGLDARGYEVLATKLAALSEARIERKTPALAIQRMPRPPEIDGELSDWWRSWSSVSLEKPSNVVPIAGDGESIGICRGPEDLSGKLYIGYDDRNLYFALDVRDLDLRPFDSETDDWIGDCLLIALDCKGDGGLFYNRDDILLSLALSRPRKKKDAKNQNGEDDDEEERRRPEGKYFVKRKDDRSGVVYECKIPWAMFREHGATIDEQAGPPKGFRFGFNIVLTDDDGERRSDGKARGATKMLTWTPSVRLERSKTRLWQGFFPEYFGKITLD